MGNPDEKSTNATAHLGSTLRRDWIKTTGLLTAGSLLAPDWLLAAPGALGVEGAVYARGDPQFEIRRQSMSWHANKPTRKPDLIVQAAHVRDVVTAVNHARAQGMKIAVHSGGHSWVHSSVRDGGMLIDLGRLRAAKIDAGTRSAEVEPALTARDFAAALAEQGLAFPVAHCGSVALGGYLLGGGSGWNGRAWGQVACFNVEAIECVLASGELIEADSARNAEIFWAARGAGPGFFGVVTRFMLKLQPLPRAITSSNYCWPIERAPVIAAWLQALQPGFAPEVETLMFMASAPPDLAEHCRPHGRMCSVGVTVFADTLEQARARLDPVAAQVPAEGLFLRDEQVATPFEALFAGVDQAFAPHRFGSDTLWSHEPLERVVTPLVERVISAPSPNSLVLCEARRKFGPYPDAAYSLAARSFVDVYAVWSEAAADGANVDWLRGSMAAIEPMGAGFYINESDLTASPTRAEHSYEPANWARLKALRAKYDPERRFHWYLGRPQDE